MGTLAIIVCGFIGAGSAARKNFVSSWIFLVNLSFSLYLAIFLTPMAVPLLDIPNLPAGCKNAIALGGLFLVLEFVLKKITDQVVPNPDADMPLPALPSKIISLCAGFFSGTLIAALILFCLVQTLVSLDATFRKNCQDASSKTFLVLVRTLNALSWQWTDPGKIPELRYLGFSSGSQAPAAKKGTSGKAKKADRTAPAAKTGKTDQADQTQNAPDQTADPAAPAEKDQKSPDSAESDVSP